MSKTLLRLMVAASLIGCEEESTSPASPPPSAAPIKKTPPPPPVPVATAPQLREDCPEGSSGEGSFNKPCEAKGDARMMEITWTGKMEDTGPKFRVVNKSKLVILYGRLAVYFYDKAGKQIEAKDDSESPPKARPYHTCYGNMFGGVMNPGEKAFIIFSCVEKKDVPEGAKVIQGEMHTVGFADASGKKPEFYWKNKDLIPEVRPKSRAK